MRQGFGAFARNLCLFAVLGSSSIGWSDPGSPSQPVIHQHFPAPVLKTGPADSSALVEGPVAERVTLELTEADFQPPFEWNENRERILNETLPIANEMYQAAKARIAEVGLREFKRKEADKDKTHRDFGDIARAEIIFIDNTPCVRIIHIQSQVSLIFMEPDHPKPNSRHLDQVISRQHIMAGGHNSWGEAKGRDTVMVRLNWHRQELISDQYYPRHLPYSPKWWTDYMRAVVQLKFHRDQTVFGVALGACQATLACGVVAAKQFAQRMNGAPVDDWTGGGPLMSFLWGAAIGAFNSTYRNVMSNTGSEQSKVNKLWIQSVLFAYTVMWWDKGWHIFDVTAPENWVLLSYVLINGFLHNQGRKAWYLIPEIRMAERESAEHLILRWGKWEYETEVSWASIEMQTFYFIPFFIKMLGVYPTGVFEVFVPGLSKPIMDLGTWVLLGSIPLVQYAALRYAKNSGYRKAEAFEKEVKAYWRGLPMQIVKAPVTVPTAIFKFATEIARWGFIGLRTCGSLVASAIAPATPAVDAPGSTD